MENKMEIKKCGALLWSIVGAAALLYPLIFIATLPRLRDKYIVIVPR